MLAEVPYGDSLVVKAVHASHHLGSERYGNSRGIQFHGNPNDDILDVVKTYCIMETS